MPLREQHIGYFKTLDSIRTPKVTQIVAWLLCAGFAIATVFLVFTPWVQTAPGTGRVIALNPNDRVQEISALVPGRIVEWYVRDGSIVRKGDPIARLEDNDPLLVPRLEAERAQLESKLSASQAQLGTSEIDLQRTRGLFKIGLASQREVELADIKVEEFRAKVAEASASLSSIDINISRQSAQIVTAPRDGQILKVAAGDASTFVNAGDVVASFAPANVARAVELFIDGRDVPLVQIGDRVRLEFEGSPAIQFSGWPTTAIGTFGGLVIAIDPSSGLDGRFRILVAEDPNDDAWPSERFARFGTNVRGWVLLNTVPVGYELWRQMNNFPPEFDRRARGEADRPAS